MSVVLVCIVAVGATLLVGALRGEDSGGQGGSMLGETDGWVAEVVDDGARVRTEDGTVLAGSEPAWDVESQRLAYVPTDGALCGVCGVERGSVGAVELVAAGADGAVLHAPAWIEGSLYYARTRGCTPGSTCSDDIVRTSPGASSTGEEQVRSPLLPWVRDLEVDPQSEDSAEEVRLAFVDAQGAALLWRGEVSRLEPEDVDDVVYSSNTHVIAGRRDETAQVEFWTRLGGHIDSVDVGVLLEAAKDDGVDTGLDVATVEAVSISAYGSESDQSFVVALRDGAGEIGAVQIEIPYNADLEAQLDEVAVVDGVIAVPFALHRGAELVELVRLREPDS